MLTIVVRERAGCALVCPVCRDELGTDGREICAECGAEHHAECLSESGCASMVCRSFEDDRDNDRDNDVAPRFSIEQNPLWRAVHEECFVGGLQGTEMRLRNPWYHHSVDDAELIISVGYTASYDDQDVLCRANRRALEGEFFDSECVTSDHRGVHVHILSEPANGEDWSVEEAILERLESLQRYPCLDESLLSELETEEIDEQLSDYALRDAIGSLALWEQNAIEDMPRDQELAAYWRACVEAGEYPSCGGYGIHWPGSAAWFAAFREELGIAGMAECTECDEYPASHESGRCAHCEGS